MPSKVSLASVSRFRLAYRRALMKHDSPGSSLASPDRTAERSSGSVSGECDVGGELENLKIVDADADVRLCEHLGDDVALGIDLTRTSEFDELIRDEAVERARGSSNRRSQKLLFALADFVLDHVLAAAKRTGFRGSGASGAL